MKIKILIAEDEQIERLALKFIIGNNMPQFDIVAEASNGIELIELAKLHRPDIMLIDIRMPAIDGLSAISQIRTFLPEIEFLVITAHADFEYAQQAIQLGASNYLVKPIKTDVLISELNKVSEKVRGFHARQKINQKLYKKIEMLKPQVDYNILLAVASANITDRISDQFYSILDMEYDHYFCVLVTNRSDRSISFEIQEKLLVGLKDHLHKISKEYIVGFVGGELLLIMPFSNQFAYSDSKNYIQEISEITKTYLDNNGIATDIQTSKMVTSLDEISIEYKLMLEISYSHNRHAEQLPQELYSLELSMCEHVVAGDSKPAIDELDKILLYINRKSNGIEKESIGLLRDVSILLKSYIFSDKEGFHAFRDNFNHLEELFNSNKFKQEIIEEIFSIVINCALFYEKKTYKNINSRIDDIIEYIKKNYKKDFSLETLAFDNCLSASYLSKALKQRLCKNYIDFITDLRVEEAKRLLSVTSKSIKEITFEIGYNSQTYFCKVFKKSVGVSASEFKEEFNFQNRVD